MLDLLKIEETPAGIKWEPHSESYSTAEKSFVRAISDRSITPLQVDRNSSPRTDALCFESKKNSGKATQFSVDSSVPLFNEKPTILMQRAVISYIESPAKFYVKNQNSEISQLELNNCSNIASTASRVQMGVVYSVQKSNDINWYRAKVCSDYKENEFFMLFIDHGFKHVVHKSK